MHGKRLHNIRYYKNIYFYNIIIILKKTLHYLHLDLYFICNCSRSGSVLGLSEVWMIVSGAQGFHCMWPEKRKRAASYKSRSKNRGVE